jgi:hypothetical protein
VKFTGPRDAGFESGLMGGPVVECGLHLAARETLYSQDMICVSLWTEPAGDPATMCKRLHLLRNEISDTVYAGAKLLR